MSDVTLVSGFPSFLAQSLVRRLLETDPAEQIALLCPGRFQVAAQIFVQELPPQARPRVEVVWGSPADLDLGLSSTDYRRLCARLTAICHLGATPSLASPPAPPRRRARKAQEFQVVAGARHMVDLAFDCPRLRRLCYVSSVMVAGDRQGVVLEEELAVGQRFSDGHAEELLHAEQLMRQAAEQRRLPTTVLRPGHLVGDSRTGEIDHFGSPYDLIAAVLRSPLDVAQMLPPLGWGAAPLHMVPVDFVADATVALLRDRRAEGQTFHLVDPCPLSLRAVADLVARHEERKVMRAPSMPPRLLRAVLRAPGIERLARANMGSLEDALGAMVFYSPLNTLRLLEGTGLRCPPATSYLDRIVAFFQEHQRGSAPEDDVSDPLD